jgi:hypothetical protein
MPKMQKRTRNVERTTSQAVSPPSGGGPMSRVTCRTRSGLASGGRPSSAASSRSGSEGQEGSFSSRFSILSGWSTSVCSVVREGEEDGSRSAGMVAWGGSEGRGAAASSDTSGGEVVGS